MSSLIPGVKLTEINLSRIRSKTTSGSCIGPNSFSSSTELGSGEFFCNFWEIRFLGFKVVEDEFWGCSGEGAERRGTRLILDVDKTDKFLTR